MIALDADAFLRGSYPPLVTPFRDGAVDYDAFARLVELQIAEGIARHRRLRARPASRAR